MHKPIKYAEKALSAVAGAAFNTVQFFNQFNPNESFVPKWSDKPLQKSWQKTKPTLGWPRVTDSLCPKCVKEARKRIIEDGEDVWKLIQEKPGEIKATIIERNGEIWMVKDCPVHGHIEDMMAVDAKFLEHIETMYPGRDIDAHNDQHVHHHASSTIKYGRGSVLTIDLTNRCNMMCDPCFMDANQVGFVHELGWEDIKEILDNAIQVKPRRQMSVQFSGGEPTLSPYFLDAVRYARKVGYNSVQAATNGIEFAKSKEFARKAAEAGLRYVYLQFDGIGNAANSHRQVGNLFDVKLKAIDNLHEAGVEIVLVTTLVNTVNNDEVGPVIRFALDNPKKIGFISFQPVSFTGRDEDITDDRRLRQRYTLSHMAHDVRKQVGITDPHKDWFPISLMSAFADFADMAHGPDREWGQMSCGCHPNCGVGTAVMIDKETKEMKPVPDFINIPSLMKDMRKITDAARGKKFSMAMMALALLKNYNSFGSPTHFKLSDLLQKFDKTFGLSGKNYGKSDPTRTMEDIQLRRKDRWNFLFIAGMWFQDLFNYDFRRTEMCIIPYGTQEGEISFCAYNTGIGWRNIIENMHQNATVAKWYQEHGRHEIFANNHSVKLSDTAHRLNVNAEDSARGREKGVLPQTAKEEQAMMRKLYMQSVLKKAGAEQKLVQIGGAGSKKEEGTGAISLSGD
ncbi:MAG TPA: radical SAM protein [Blastocatellia bacterium]|nr:radical SAM protein [Blastocatellia bacterium]HMY75356.1 radical SAM protein [Blastocatellia bacterium]HMZ20192.1 radical SAM protein [Blastocatellia bacterium]